MAGGTCFRKERRLLFYSIFLQKRTFFSQRCHFSQSYYNSVIFYSIFAIFALIFAKNKKSQFAVLQSHTFLSHFITRPVIDYAPKIKNIPLSA